MNLRDLLISSLLLVSTLTACSGYSITGGPGKTVSEPAQTESAQPKELLDIHSVYIAPVRFAAGVKQSEALSEILTASLHRSVKGSLDLELLEPDSVPEPFRGTDEQTQNRYLNEIASKLEADSLLITTVQQYTDRIGSSAAAEQSAKIAFTMKLFKVGGAHSVWQASYFFKDEALSENLLRLGERVKEVKKDGRRGWWTAQELFERGASELALKLSRERRGLFARKSS